MLCQHCRIFAHSVLQQRFSTPWCWYDKGDGKKFASLEHGSYTTIKQNAEAGCQFCRLFLPVWNLVPVPMGHPYAKTSRIASCISWASGDMGRNFLNHEDKPGYTFNFQPTGLGQRATHFDASSGMTFEVCKVLESRLVQGSLAAFDSTAGVSCARSWLTECESSHVACKRSQPSKLPTRVIDVGSFESLDDVKLFESNGTAGRYVTLSYCWGQDDPLKTTTDNILSHRSRIDLDRLPKTLGDAIRFARLIGFRYLWIDALCIIQDDAEDWQREAAKMCSIYEDATLSISILDSESCGTGFLSGKPGLEELEADGKTATVGLRWIKYPFPYPLLRRVLESRAWTLQERTLAPAVLHLSTDAMYWECCTGWASQDETQIKPIHGQMRNELHSPEHVFAIRPILRQGKGTEALRLWYGLVVMYMNRTLSRPSDRLAAMHGLAMKFQSCRKDKYTFGHWPNDMHHDLIWSPIKVSGEDFTSSVPTPSWDWVTAGVHIDFPYVAVGREGHHTLRDFSPRADITIITHNTPSALPLSRAMSLQIRGLFQQGTLRGKHARGSQFVADSSNPLWDDINGTLDVLNKDFGSFRNRFQTTEPTADDLRRFPDAETISVYDRPVSCLMIASQHSQLNTRPKNQPGVTYYYLILEKVEPEDKDCDYWRALHADADDGTPMFRRIGRARKLLVEREDGWTLESGRNWADIKAVSEEFAREWNEIVHGKRGRRDIILV